MRLFDSRPNDWLTSSHATRTPENSENRTPQEEIALFLEWADEYRYNTIPAITALRGSPMAEQIHDAIQWADQQGFTRIAAALRQRAVPH
jgi:hypothetical protein